MYTSKNARALQRDTTVLKKPRTKKSRAIKLHLYRKDGLIVVVKSIPNEFLLRMKL
jgi:hypothetical protein